MHIDRRRSPRIELLGRVQGSSAGHGQPLNVREISLGGMAIETPTPFEVGAVHAFRLTLGDKSTVELSGRVVHSRRDASSGDSALYVTGVRFLDDESDDGAAAVGEIIDRVR